VKKENRQLAIYRLLMQEVKDRIVVIDHAMAKESTLWPRAAYELCHLQLRLICEVIALGSLAAHGDVPGAYSKRLLKTYEPHKIFLELQGLHPNFYPRACKKEIQQTPQQIEVLMLEDEEFPSKDDLIALHGKTGNVLHRGRLKDIGRPIRLDFQEFQTWRNKIVDMLAVHLISLIDRERYVLVIMQDPATGQVATAEITATNVSDGWREDAERRERALMKK
jgi:hypothetical protein